MKRISALLLACLLAISAAMAQKLKITEVRQAMEPMTVPMQRLDANGDICALVKVSLPHEGVRFEGNVVGEPLFKTNEYWVYMTGGTKMLNIKAPGYYSVMVDFRQHDIGALESKAIYYIVLEPEAAQTAAAPPRVEANYAVITVEPASATVRIDGQPRQVTGGTVTALLKLGSHTYEVENTGYQTANGSFEITTADKTRLNVSLVSNMRTLSVTTDAGATISIDGAVKSRGKWQGSLLPGMYSIEIQRPGYRPWKKVVELADSDVSLQIGDTEFTPVYGTLNVDYRPVGAIVKLNGQTVGDTPLNKPDVLCGQYTLTIESPGHATYSQSVTIDESTPVNLTGQLDQHPTATTGSAATTGSTATQSGTQIGGDTFVFDTPDGVVEVELAFDNYITLHELFTTPLGFLKIKQGSFWSLSEEQVTKLEKTAIGRRYIKNYHSGDAATKYHFCKQSISGIPLYRYSFQYYDASIVYGFGYKQPQKNSGNFYAMLKNNPDVVEVNKNTAKKMAIYPDRIYEKQFYHKKYNILIGADKNSDNYLHIRGCKHAAASL